MGMGARHGRGVLGMDVVFWAWDLGLNLITLASRCSCLLPSGEATGMGGDVWGTVGKLDACT